VHASQTTAFVEPSATGGGERAGQMWMVFPHMHTLGRSYYFELDHPDGQDECLLNIENNWNFHWQNTYVFADPVQVKGGDQLKITCTWDNTVDQQPLVDGLPQEPREVHAGDRATDEMCVGYFILTD
jgi:hypothetical protein